MSERMGLIRYLLFISIVTSPLAGFAAPMNVDLIDEIKAVSIIPIHEDALAQDPEGFAVTYDPAELTEASADITREDIMINSAFMKSDEYQIALTKHIIIPVATTQDHLMNNLQDFNADEIKTFISKKTQFLKKVSKAFAFFRLKPSTINKIVSTLNDQFFANANAVASANAKAMTIQLKVSGGVGFSDWILNKLKTNSYLKHLPSTSGFYFVFSSGLSLVVTKKDGKSKISIEPVLEFRRMTKVFTPFVTGSAGLTGSYTVESRTENDPALQVAQFYSMPGGLTILSNVNQFGLSTNAALAFPPGGGAAAAFEGKLYRLRIKAAMIPQVISSSKEFLFKSARAVSARMCSMIFGS